MPRARPERPSPRHRSRRRAAGSSTAPRRRRPASKASSIVRLSRATTPSRVAARWIGPHGASTRPVRTSIREVWHAVRHARSGILLGSIHDDTADVRSRPSDAHRAGAARRGHDVRIVRQPHRAVPVAHAGCRSGRGQPRDGAGDGPLRPDRRRSRGARRRRWRRRATTSGRNEPPPTRPARTSWRPSRRTTVAARRVTAGCSPRRWSRPPPRSSSWSRCAGPRPTSRWRPSTG